MCAFAIRKERLQADVPYFFLARSVPPLNFINLLGRSKTRAFKYTPVKEEGRALKTDD